MELQRLSWSSQASVWSTAENFSGKRQRFLARLWGSATPSPSWGEHSTAVAVRMALFPTHVWSMHWDERCLLISSHETNCRSLLLTWSLILKPIFTSMWQKRKDWWTAVKGKWRFRTNSISLLQTSYSQDTKSLGVCKEKWRKVTDKTQAVQSIPSCSQLLQRRWNCFPHPAVLHCWQSPSYLL